MTSHGVLPHALMTSPIGQCLALCVRASRACEGDQGQLQHHQKMPELLQEYSRSPWSCWELPAVGCGHVGAPLGMAQPKRRWTLQV